jgi:hypothetical protein
MKRELENVYKILIEKSEGNRILWRPRHNEGIILKLILNRVRMWTGLGDAIAQGVSSPLPTVAARVWSQVRSCRICDAQSGTRAGLLQVFNFIYKFSFPQQHTHPSSEAGTMGQRVGCISSRLSHPTPTN